MNMNDMILVSVDDHVVEPPNLFDKHLDARYRDKAPKMHSMHDGNDSWIYEGKVVPNFGLNAVVGRPREEYGFEPAAYDHIRKGAWDVDARVDDMNVNGVLGSICFPTFPHFAGTLFLGASDKAAARAIISAYNDWHIHEWCAAAPGRFIPIAMLPLWDIDACVAEAKRVAALGVRTITFPDVPAHKGLPSLHGDHWDPLWKVMSDNKMVVSTHIGSGINVPYLSPESPIDSWIVTMPMSIANATADWLFSPIFMKFPDLKIALSEGGIGWIPYFLERADFTHDHHSAWTNSKANLAGLKPSERFHRNFITCFIDDAFGLQNTRFLNEDMLTWECDYPHSDTVWPNCPEALWASIKHLPEESINKITHLNVMREFGYDPFTLLGRENCTVGALRAKATHVDTAPRAGMGGHNPSKGDGKVVSAGEVAKLFAA